MGIPTNIITYVRSDRIQQTNISRPRPMTAFNDVFYSVVVLEESPCPRGSSRTNFQVLVLVLVLELQVLVLVLVLGSSSPRKFSRTE